MAAEKRILLIGNTGQVGWELQRTLAPLGSVTALDYPEINLAETEQIPALVDRIKPHLIVNAAAYTAVDRAEAEPELALGVNGKAPGALAAAARSAGAAFVHYSTDYVFDGRKGSPYVEADPPNPLGVYAASKFAGEQAVQSAGGAYLILRTSWVYSLRRGSFVTKVLAWARKNPVLQIVDDQISNPTWCRMLAEVTAQLIAMGGDTLTEWMADRRGLYHLAGDGYASRLDWARAILRYDPKPEEQLATEIQPAATADFPAPAERPLFSALNCDRFKEAFGLQLPDWEEALELAMVPG